MARVLHANYDNFKQSKKNRGCSGKSMGMKPDSPLAPERQSSVWWWDQRSWGRSPGYQNPQSSVRLLPTVPAQPQLPKQRLQEPANRSRETHYIV